MHKVYFMCFKVLNSYERFHAGIGSHILGHIEFNEVIRTIREILTENDPKKLPASFLHTFTGMLCKICEN
jgi:hypothetical protein